MRRRGVGVAAALLFACSATGALAQVPFEISGEVETSISSRRLPSDDRHEVRSQTFASTHVSTYLGQPWIATVVADLDVALDSDLRGSFNGARSVAGNVLLSGLPSSRAPFQLFFSASDNRFDRDYSGTDYTRMRGGVSGRVALGDRSSFDYLVSHDELNRVNYGRLTSQRADGSLRHAFDAAVTPLNITDVGLTLNYYNTDFKGARAGDLGYASESLSGTIFYRAEPAERLNHDFTATLISDNFGNKQDRYDRWVGQTVGTLQWRSPTNEVVTTSAVRLMAQQVDHRFVQEKTDTDSALMAASAGLSWRVSDQLTLSMGVRGQAEHVQTVVDDHVEIQPDAVRSTYAGGTLAAIDYRSVSRDLAGFNWHWDARAAGDLDINSNRYVVQKYETIYGRRTDANVTLSHTLSRMVGLPFVEAVNFSLVQEGGFAHYSYDGLLKPVIMHSASIMKVFADERGASYFRVYFRDNHAFGERPEEYQSAQADFTRHVVLGGNQSINGNLGVQVVRQQRDLRDEVYVFSRADVEYEYRDLFRIDGLSFVSTLRINALGQNDLRYDWRDELSPDLFRNDWRNKVQYKIGKLWLALEGTIFQADKELGHYVRFSGRRTFDFVD